MSIHRGGRGPGHICRHALYGLNTAQLGPLSLSTSTFVHGTPSSGTIIGAALNSTISGIGFPAGFSINSSARTWSFDGSGNADSGTMTLTEISGAQSNQTNIDWTIAAGVPVISVDPVISATEATRGYTATCDGGTWTNGPTSYSYQWQRGGVNISGATNATYTFVSADVGATITCNVTATNPAGNSLPDSSNSLGPVAAAVPPDVDALPTISGDTTVGSILTSSGSTWTGDPPPTITRQWKRNGAAITGATGQSYALVTADNGATITISVTGTNVAGSLTATSAGVGPITLSTPSIDSTVPAPVMSVTSSQAAYPPTLGWTVHSADAQATVYQIQFQCSTSSSFVTTVFDDTLSISDAEATANSKLDTSLSAITTGTHYFRSRLLWTNGGTATASAWSNVVGHGSTAAPVISTATGNPAYSGQPLALSLTADKLCSCSIISGTEMGFFEIEGPAFGTQLLHWLNKGTQSTSSPKDAGLNNTYDVTIRFTDYFGNYTDLNEEITVNPVGTPVFGTSGFTPVTSAPQSTLETSNAVVMSGMTAGINYTSTCSTGGDYRVSTDGGTTWGPWTAGDGVTPFYMQNGWAIQVRQSSSASYSTETDVTVTIGGVQSTYAVTTGVAPGAAGFTYHTQGTGTNSVVLSSVTFLTGYRVVITRGNVSATSVSLSSSGSLTKIATSGKEDIWISSASHAGATETVTAAFTSGTWCVAIALSGVNLASSTPTSKSTKAIVSQPDPKLFDDTLTVPSPGIGLAAALAGGATSITWNNGATKLGEGYANGTTFRYGCATIPTTQVISFSSNTNNTGEGVAAAWSQA